MQSAKFELAIDLDTAKALGLELPPAPTGDRIGAMSLLALTFHILKGRAGLLCPSNSDVNLFGDFKRIIDLYFEVPDGALDFGVPKK